MNVLKQIVLFPLRIVLQLLRLFLKEFIELECHIAGIAILFLAFCILVTILKGTWINLGILAVLAVAVIIALMIPSYLLILVEDQLEKLNE